MIDIILGIFDVSPFVSGFATAILISMFCASQTFNMLNKKHDKQEAYMQHQIDELERRYNDLLNKMYFDRFMEQIKK